MTISCGSSLVTDLGSGYRRTPGLHHRRVLLGVGVDLHLLVGLDLVSPHRLQRGAKQLGKIEIRRLPLSCRTVRAEHLTVHYHEPDGVQRFQILYRVTFHGVNVGDPPLLQVPRAA